MPPAPTTSATAHRWRRRLRRILWFLGACAALLLVAYLGMRQLMLAWVAPIPELDEVPPIVRTQPETRGDRLYLGRNWFGKRNGLQVLYLTGSEFEMGYANGVLTQDLIHRQEQTILDLVKLIAPYRWTQFLLEFAVVYKNRHLHEYISPAQQMEMLGLSLGCPDQHPEMGPQFNRILSFHAAQDISYMLMHSPLIRPGCTSFGAWGAHTRDARLLAGRNFDWEAAPIFDQERLVILCEPTQGIPFVSLAWAGMVGVVSGLNREGLAITVNGAPSNLPSDTATPTCLVAREVLQHAKTLAEAIDIIRQSRVFVSALFLVGSRHDGQFVVVEKTPSQTAVRDPGNEPWIICANHYLTTNLSQLPINLEALRTDTSQARHDRAAELVRRAATTLDPSRCADILRDRRLFGDTTAGNGHRSSLNPLIATHSVVLDLTDGIFWAASPPHQLGRFIAFDVNDPERELPDRTLPADPMLTSGEFDRFRESRQHLSEGWAHLEQGNATAALSSAKRAEENNPGSYLNSWLLAEVHRARRQKSEAAAAARHALNRHPALGTERRKLEALLEKLEPATRTHAQTNSPTR